MNKQIIDMLPPMLAGDELIDALRVLPEYDKNIVYEPIPKRLVAMSDMYNIYEPSRMSVEIYNKLYLALLRSLQKKGTRMATIQHTENRRAVLGVDYNSIMGGIDSFTIIGESGIGKSRAISRAISLIYGEEIIVIEHPYLKLIPVCCVQCQFDSSVKGMLLEILRKVDESIGSNYHNNALRGHMTTDMLIGSVSQVCLNHIGLLVVDEIQNVIFNKNGRNLVSALTQLINNSGVSICMVGTQESSIFFESQMYLARRATGLQYGAMHYDQSFRTLCKILLSYRYTKEPLDYTEGLFTWLYNHSGGNVSALVTIIHDAQEMAIINGNEQLNIKTFSDAYDRSLSFLHDYIQIPEIALTKPKKPKLSLPDNKTHDHNNVSIKEIVQNAKATGADVIEMVKADITIEEVAL